MLSIGEIAGLGTHLEQAGVLTPRVRPEKQRTAGTMPGLPGVLVRLAGNSTVVAVDYYN